MVEIKYVGLDALELEQGERQRVEHDVAQHVTKIGRLVPNSFELVVQFKVFDRTGDRKRFSVHARAVYPGGVVTAEKEEWLLATALQECLHAIEGQLHHKFKI